MRQDMLKSGKDEFPPAGEKNTAECNLLFHLYFPSVTMPKF
jgi:hypothetical protein